MTKPLVRIVDDDAALADSFELLLTTMGWDVRYYPDGRTFLDTDSLSGPGCVVLDMRMPGMTGLEVQAEMERRGATLPVLFLSAHGTISTAVHAVRHGAVDFLEKPVEPLEFVQKVSSAVTLSMQAALESAPIDALKRTFADLTPRERDVVRSFLKGDQIKETARALGLEVSTIKMHRSNAFAKFGVHSQRELLRLVLESGVTDPEELLDMHEVRP